MNKYSKTKYRLESIVCERQTINCNERKMQLEKFDSLKKSKKKRFSKIGLKRPERF
jgi:hypothetical protein